MSHQFYISLFQSHIFIETSIFKFIYAVIHSVNGFVYLEFCVWRTHLCREKERKSFNIDENERNILEMNGKKKEELKETKTKTRKRNQKERTENKTKLGYFKEENQINAEIVR